MALIDGDVVCYHSFEPRWEFNVNERGERVFEVDPETGNAKPVLKTYTKEEDAKYLQDSWARFQRRVRELVETLYCDDFMMAVQGPGNYRPKIHQFYKMHQGRQGSKPSEMSRFVPVIRQLAVREDLAVPSTGREADDMLRIWAEE